MIPPESILKCAREPALMFIAGVGLLLLRGPIAAGLTYLVRDALKHGLGLGLIQPRRLRQTPQIVVLIGLAFMLMGAAGAILAAAECGR